MINLITPCLPHPRARAQLLCSVNARNKSIGSICRVWGSRSVSWNIILHEME